MTKTKNFLNNLIKTFGFSSSREGHNEEDLERIAQQEQKVFPFETLVAATKDFHSSNKLGQGGFGPVYKGKLADGRDIAVKKLAQGSSQGKKEFMNEAKLLARVQHRNVVNLLGYCVHGVEKLLVYEYVVNESLDKLLFKPERRQELDWKRRYDIICGVAKGLLYLHEDSHNRIIHRDIKASNILLDDKWVPKIADFGMARLFPEDQTHVNTRVAGTNGYMAPEYVMHGHLSEKADVFSFGVLVLELITGQRNSSFNLNVDEQSLLDWAYKLYKKGRSLEIMDPTLAPSADADQVAMCIHVGLLCVQGDPQVRPAMHRVVVILSKKPSNLEEPSRPGLPGSRYRRSHRPAGLSSTAGTSGESNSHSSGSTFTATGTSSASHVVQSRGTSSEIQVVQDRGTSSGTRVVRDRGTSSGTRVARDRGKRPMES
ncbi:PREDICTED: putative receptor-like protein kinase At4g00960 [Fragaria vesca subsp. vesca]|uniref:putative receptor-like protein kinase At4g00960 n=1 Tax=Fragaria vesca subsp. vesca TaxID=101020 RepID=UPI0002C2EC90|nr:PREDICTED: putative receptor-like protein kinase At4g00960 [Fragaria vesca subsp. vesca]